MGDEKRIKVFSRGHGVVREAEVEREREAGRLFTMCLWPGILRATTNNFAIMMCKIREALSVES